MQLIKTFIASSLFFASISLVAQQQNRPIDNYFCNALKVLTSDANNHFVEQTNRDRVVLLNPKAENRFESSVILPGFFYGKVISLGAEGLYYESIAPNIPDSATVHYGLQNVNRHILHCVPNIALNPISDDGLQYSYHYKYGDTISDIFIRLWGEYPSVDEDSFASSGQINIEIYGDDYRKFTPYKKDKKKADSTLTAQFSEIEKGLLDSIALLLGKESYDLYKNKIWLPKRQLKGAGNIYIKPLPETLQMPYGYYAELYAGPNQQDAEKVYKQWIDKVKQNALADKRFKQKNRQLLQWHFLPYNEWFDPDDYANIKQQVGFSAPLLSAEPINRTPLFTYHLFLLKYAGDYIVAINISNRY